MARSSLPPAVELLKPVTWFAPMWAFACGVISAGGLALEQVPLVLTGVLLAGPLVCGTSQAVNDWFDRHVDAINEPHRPIPSGRIPGRVGLYIALGWTALSLAVATALGLWGFGAAAVGLALAWLYSAPPVRLKRNGWWGNAAVALCYEGLPWFTGAAVIAAAAPDSKAVILAFLYSIGAHGIMTLNDFKSIEGDRRTGIASLPVQLGTRRAAWLACVTMAVPQMIVAALLVHWDRPVHALVVAVSVLVQIRLMARMMMKPRDRAAWYNATGTLLYVLGMLAAAFALQTSGGAP